MSTRNFGRYSFDASNEDKELFPEAGITKGELIDYYTDMAQYMLPHMRERALAMQRFPEGIDDGGFYQKNAADYFPSWIRTTELSKHEGGKTDAVIAHTAATLAWLANQAMITPHLWLSRVDRPDTPDRMLFDLDPAGKEFTEVIDAALALHDFCEEEMDLRSFVMTTGSRGMHVVIPLRRDRPFDAVRTTAMRICDAVAKRHPERFTTEQRKQKREGRLYLDATRNAYGMHSVAPYGVRATPGAPVAAPLTWEEVRERRDSLHADAYSVRNIRRRLAKREDPWKGMRKHAVSFPEWTD